MGGSTFAPSLHCPRMPLPQYLAVKCHFTSRLEQLFHHVAVATEAPEKRDYGDVDFLVCRPKGSVLTGTCLEDVKGQLQREMGAVEARLLDGVLVLGCPMPDVASGGEMGARVKEEEREKKEFVQLDIQLCHAPSHLAYMLFAHAHGDLFGFLKTGVRPFGLSLRPSGLWVRVADAEQQQETGGKLTNGNLTNGWGSSDARERHDPLFFLSNDVDAILKFLGLSKRKWEQPFDSLQDVFEYAVSARWFSKRDFHGENGESKLSQPQTHRAKHSYEAYKAQRRNIWNVFTSYLSRRNLPADPFTTSPSNKDSSSAAIETKHRNATLLAALSHFTTARSRYAVHLATRAAARREAAFWARVKAALPALMTEAQEGTSSGQEDHHHVAAQRVRRVVLAMRRYTEFARAVDVRDLSGGEAGMMGQPRLRRAGRPVVDEGEFCSWTASSNLTDDDLMAFVEDNWAVAYELDRARTRPLRVARRDEAAKRRTERRKGQAV
ncbi:hypothetical protein IWZ03DRAFT_407257 [Phyllosticta citriasiana]|uniref:Uncharacterized protein n=1 Tax=Phyllosticta citriasiana TaxID=595635 RepID=A0ABR1KMI2_9PEZI